ncbi:LamG domain-containing protein [Micromonospora sonneratiae]|uniref:LamG-like jellyroll fold domain-containing protein n=1 Tax=Micromonospora sonneratiae TaxID=1184706 RepID=A0ABW3YAB0_9ACTN
MTNIREWLAATKGTMAVVGEYGRRRAWLRRGLALVAVTGLMTGTVWAFTSRPGPQTAALPATGVPAGEWPRRTEAQAADLAAVTGKQVEVLDERGESRQVFANPDGTMTAMTYQQPIQTVQNGKWVPTDATLVRHADGSVGPQAALTNLRLSGGGDGLFASVERAGRRYALRWPGILPAPQLSGSTATYAEVLPDVDLVAHASVTGFTHVFVVKTRAAALSPQVRQIRFGLELQLLRVEKSASGALRMVDAATGGPVFDTPVPRMWDASAPVGAGDPTKSAPDGAAVARVGTVLGPDSLTLVPDQQMMDSPNTRFPLYIDPFTAATNNESWAMVDSGYPNEEYWKFDGDTDERVGYCPVGVSGQVCNASRVKRIYYVLGTNYAGKTIISASFGVTQSHTWNGTAHEVSLYRANSGGALISSATNWNNRPNSLTLQQTISTGAETACQTGATRNVWFNATESVQKAVASGWTKTTYMLRAVNESSYLHLKRYCANAVLSVTYNRAPHQPAVSGLSMSVGGGCVSGVNRPYVSSMPTLKAILSDPDTADAELLTANFEVKWTATDGSQQTKTWTSGQLGNGATFSYNLADINVGVPNLPQDVVVSWKVRANDGVVPGPWSSDNGSHACEFILDTEKPAGPDIDSPEYLPHDADNIDPKKCPETADPNNPELEAPWLPGVGRYGTFTFDSAATDVSEYWYAFDTNPTSANKILPAVDGGPVTIQWQPLVSKPYTLYVLAVDRAGKTSDISSCIFRVAEGSGPIADWRLDEAAGSPTAVEAVAQLSARAEGGTRFGVAGPGGLADKAVHLDGAATSGLSTEGPVVDTAANFTVSAWVRLADLSRYQTVLSQDGTGEPGFQLGYSQGSGKWYVNVANNDVQALGSWGPHGTAAQVNAWTHLTATFDVVGQKITLYVNGAEAGSANWRAAWASHGGLQIGRRFNRTGVYSEVINGDIADVRIWDRTLVPSEILTLPTQLINRTAYWDLDGATMVTDEPPMVAVSSEYGQMQPDGTRLIDRALDMYIYHDAEHYRRLSEEEGGGPFDPVPLVGDGHLVLDGATGYAATANAVAVTDGSFTVTARVQVATDCSTGPMTVLSQPGRHASGFKLGCAPDGPDSALWQVFVPGTDQDAASGVTVTGSEAIARPNPSASIGQFLTVTYDAAYGKLTLYVDGVAVGSASGVALPWAATSGGLQVGRSLTDSVWGSYLAGVVDEVRVYTGALDQTTIQQLNANIAVPEI